MIIGVCGFGYTGSGAVYDLLSEYEGISRGLRCEMSFLYRPDGISDLYYHLYHPTRFFSSDYAIKRFREKIHKFFRNHPEQWGLKDYSDIYKLTDDYLNSITDVKWKGWWTDDTEHFSSLKFFMYRVITKLTKAFPAVNIRIQKALYYRDMCLSVKPECFLENTRKYIEDLYTILGFDINKEKIILDQAFSANNPNTSSIFYRNPKTIIVDKDPRDLYLMLKKESFKDCAWTPTERVEDFVIYYRQLRRDYEDINTDEVLLVRFEDMIYEYDQSVKRVEEYLGLNPDSHIKPFYHFDPKLSINNTQLFRKYPEMKEDVQYIEKMLPQYLFDYDKYPPLTKFGKAFDNSFVLHQ